MDRVCLCSQRVVPETCHPFTSALFRARLGLAAPADTPDRINLAIQIAFACLRWGYLQDAFLSPAIRAEAVRATTAYIAPFVTGKSRTDHSSGGERS